MRLHTRMLKRSPLILEEWDDTIWTVMVEKAIVHRDGSITFHFYNGGIITELNDQKPPMISAGRMAESCYSKARNRASRRSRCS